MIYYRGDVLFHEELSKCDPQRMVIYYRTTPRDNRAARGII